MTLEELKELLETIPGFNNKIAYGQYPAENAPRLPFICYLVTNTDNFYADDIVFALRTNIAIRLYSQKKDLLSESLVEAALKTKDIGWNKTEDFIDSESCYLIEYNIQI